MIPSCLQIFGEMVDHSKGLTIATTISRYVLIIIISLVTYVHMSQWLHCSNSILVEHRQFMTLKSLRQTSVLKFCLFGIAAKCAGTLCEMITTKTMFILSQFPQILTNISKVVEASSATRTSAVKSFTINLVLMHWFIETFIENYCAIPDVCQRHKCCPGKTIALLSFFLLKHSETVCMFA